MRTPNPQQFLEKLAKLIDGSPEVRLGQLLANLGFLAETRAGQSLWDIEDAQLLEVMEQHHEELTQLVDSRLIKRST
jgi:hypothetical protein